MMKSVLFILGLAVASAGSSAVPRETVDSILAQCRAKCNELPAKLDHTKPGVCSDYAKQRPFPLIFNVCEDTYRAGWVYGCERGCEEDAVCFGVTGGPQFNAKRTSTCKPYSDMTPRPIMNNICRYGFARGAEDRCSESYHFVKHALEKAGQDAAEKAARADAERLAEMEAQLLAAQKAQADEAAARAAAKAEKAAAKAKAAEEEKAAAAAAREAANLRKTQ